MDGQKKQTENSFMKQLEHVNVSLTNLLDQTVIIKIIIRAYTDNHTISENFFFFNLKVYLKGCRLIRDILGEVSDDIILHADPCAHCLHSRSIHLLDYLHPHHVLSCLHGC